MKKWVVFLLGFISGGVFIIALSVLATVILQSEDKGITFFEQPGDCLSTNQFEVMQALDGNYALAYEQEYKKYGGYTNTDLLVLVTNENGEPYYDEQIIKVPSGKCMRHIGIYKYQTKSQDWKTVPIVQIMDK